MYLDSVISFEQCQNFFLWDRNGNFDAADGQDMQEK